MTCREFKHQAEAFTLWELARGQDGEILHHVQQCDSCGGWLQEQRRLAASLQTLQARTAALQAGPEVEYAVLQAFRQRLAVSADLVRTSPAEDGLAKSQEQTANSEWRMAKSELPLALRLSRWFEIGAYAAVAAAVVVGVFLGVRLLQHSSRPVTVQSQAKPEIAKPLLQQPGPLARAAVARAGVKQPGPLARAAVARAGVKQSGSPTRAAVAQNRVEKTSAAPEVIAKAGSAPSSQPRTAVTRKRPAPVQAVHSGDDEIALARLPTEDLPSEIDPDYVPLMFCDPLSCSSGSQVVRMELPAAGPSSQPQTADVVVGYDGVVRAVRIEN